MNRMKANVVSQFPTNGSAAWDSPQNPEYLADIKVEEPQGRNPYREAAPRPPSAESTNPRIAEMDIDDNWPASISRDEPEKLSAETKAHTFFVRTKRRELMSNIDVLGLIAKCPDAGDGQGVVIHRDVILALAHDLLDKVHELEQIRKEEKPGAEPRYDEKLSSALDKLGDKDAEIKELRAALGEASVKIRRLESKIFK